MRLSSFLKTHAVRMPHKTALIVEDTRLTFAELQQAVENVARGLHALGLNRGDRIAIYAQNGVELVTITYAAWALGAAIIPVTTRNTQEELSYFVSDGGARMLVLDGRLDPEIRRKLGAGKDLTLISLDGAEEGAVRYSALSQPSTASLPDVPVSCDEAVIMYTSGTTGKPKGAVLTHANLFITSSYSTIQWGLSENDIGLVTTPLAHRTGLARMVNAYCLGAALVVMKRFDVEQSLALIEREKISVIGMVPTVGRMMLPALQAKRHDCDSLRHLLVTGEAFPVELKKEIASLLPRVRLCSFFAMTESGTVSALSHEEQFSHPASVGRICPGIEVKITDDAGSEVPTDAVGEIWVRSGAPGQFTTMKKYHGRPRETEESIVDGWFRTGDMGRFDADGYLYIVDRKKDMVISGGFNIYTKEVEQTLLQHPDIEDVAVVGVPDEMFGEAVAAFVQLRGGSTLSAEGVQEFTKSRIASYKKPKYVLFRTELPRNALGKVLKTELRNVASEEVRLAH